MRSPHSPEIFCIYVVIIIIFLIQALELLGKWNPMDVEDALELLSSQFTNRAVRHYAVSRLKEANDDVSKIDLGNNDNVISRIINDEVSVISW